jgi:hypothetical protein
MGTNSPEVQSRLAILRAKSLDGTLTLDEMREAIRIMIADRKSAVQRSASVRRSKAKAEIKHADEMLDELLGDKDART